MIFVGGIMEEKDVELGDVTKKFGDFVAVDDISFSVRKYEGTVSNLCGTVPLCVPRE